MYGQHFNLLHRLTRSSDLMGLGIMSLLCLGLLACYGLQFQLLFSWNRTADCSPADSLPQLIMFSSLEMSAKARHASLRCYTEETAVI